MNDSAERIQAIVNEAATPPDSRWKDEWERGYDAGRLALARELLKIFKDVQ